MSILTL